MVQNPPPNVQRIVPNLCYQDAPAAIEFLCAAFGFEEAMRMEMPDGRLGHAELLLHGDTLMLASAFEESGLGGPQGLAHLHSMVTVYVDDIDAHHERAVAAGAEIMEPPTDMFWGDRILPRDRPGGSALDVPAARPRREPRADGGGRRAAGRPKLRHERHTNSGAGANHGSESS